MKKPQILLTSAIALWAASAAQAETFKFAMIDPFSGPAAMVTERIEKVLRYGVDEVNAEGGLNGEKIEILTFDNKMSPQETAIQAQKAIDAGATILQTSVSSSNTFALVDFVRKHNRRNPDHKVIVFDGASHDPAITGEKCSYYSFSWVLNAHAKTAGLAAYLKSRPDITKVFLLNAEGSSGQTSRQAFLDMVGKARPDIEWVGDDTHPLQKITDFAPYIAKIRASGAQAVITSDWGADLSLVLKAAGEGGLKAEWFTFFSTGPGAPTAIAQAGLDGLVYSVFDGDPGLPDAGLQAHEVAFRAATGISASPFPGDSSALRALVAAAQKAGSLEVDPLVAALEGSEFRTIYGAPATLRPEDHQLLTQMSVSKFAPVTGAALDEEGTGWGWHNVAVIPASEVTLPSTCKMKRP
ncbi:branched-chain amino acid ABC transporter substrate-binding protein [Pseudooceanicola sp. CBS1P-1]|uniref:ABC transporter substrate-binding protein n=1 Tax=Pseudooceanicola albus TaxID=2692189 RepID=A0A6L7G6J9_9RHOB|nr:MULTISPECIES: branched-chain amino acid ABC transporter substrate-binding protein [Pseudooceanicola]MBT9386020.1 branched-chain amino acid ABC transporter substrate-binding protein [Pseudooceanicola endophyticus]MXN19559.1 ABC transporter substrate-binding protein [Pseudooceanicola albus]